MRFPAITAQTIASPRIVYLKGADVRLSASDEPDAHPAAPVQPTDDDGDLQVQRMRVEGLL